LGYLRSDGGLGKEKSIMADQQIRATHQEVEGFVAKLRNFHGSLSDSELAMLETVLQSAQGGETGGYGLKVRFADQGGPKPWEDLVGWIENQGEEDTQGFAIRCR
jgi:hypothetical protein